MVFRSHPNYRGKGHWRDWVMIQWEMGDYPAQIWAFVDLSALPEGYEVELDEETVLSNNTYAIVESALFVEEEDPLSEIWIPVHFNETTVDPHGRVQQRKYYVVDVESFQEPLVVIPNIGGPQTEYLMMRPRSKWSDDFMEWLDAPHTVDKEQMQELEAKHQAIEEEAESGSEDQEEEEEDDHDGDDDEGGTDEEAEEEEE